jgi:hypothetical protein
MLSTTSDNLIDIAVQCPVTTIGNGQIVIVGILVGARIPGLQRLWARNCILQGAGTSDCWVGSDGVDFSMYERIAHLFIELKSCRNDYICKSGL